jgi:hypothetical protein
LRQHLVALNDRLAKAQKKQKKKQAAGGNK